MDSVDSSFPTQDFLFDIFISRVPRRIESHFSGDSALEIKFNHILELNISRSFFRGIKKNSYDFGILFL